MAMDPEKGRNASATPRARRPTDFDSRPLSLETCHRVATLHPTWDPAPSSRPHATQLTKHKPGSSSSVSSFFLSSIPTLPSVASSTPLRLSLCSSSPQLARSLARFCMGAAAAALLLRDRRPSSSTPHPLVVIV
jgi:hypothetical protein